MLRQFLFGSMFALPGLFVIGVSTVTSGQLSTILIFLGLALTIGLPGYMLWRGKRGSKAQDPWTAEVNRRLTLVERFVLRFSGVSGLSINRNHLEDLARAEGTEDLWPQIEEAISTPDVHKASSKARSVLTTASRYRQTS